MVIVDKYVNSLSRFNQLTDDEYIKWQILSLNTGYFGEISAIKNIYLEHMAFSNSFAEAFGLNSSYLGKKLQSTPYISDKICQGIYKEELKVITSKISSEILFHINFNNQHLTYVMKKRPLINPTTDHVVGILINALHYDAIRIRKMLLSAYRHELISKEIPVDIKSFTNFQQQLIACLLVGYHQRKEIASILCQVTQNNVNEYSVKNALQALYAKYNCNTPGDLINLICLNNQIKQHAIPDVIISNSVYSTKE